MTRERRRLETWTGAARDASLSWSWQRCRRRGGLRGGGWSCSDEAAAGRRESALKQSPGSARGNASDGRLRSEKRRLHVRSRSTRLWERAALSQQQQKKKKNKQKKKCEEILPGDERGKRTRLNVRCVCVCVCAGCVCVLAHQQDSHQFKDRKKR